MLERLTLYFGRRAGAALVLALIGACSIEPQLTGSQLRFSGTGAADSLSVSLFAAGDVVESDGAAFDYSAGGVLPLLINGLDAHHFELAGEPGGIVEIPGVPSYTRLRARLEWHGRDETRLATLMDDGIEYNGEPSFMTHVALSPAFIAPPLETVTISIVGGESPPANISILFDGPDVPYFELIDADEGPLDHEQIYETFDLGQMAEALELLNFQLLASTRLRPADDSNREVLADATITHVLPSKSLQIFVASTEITGSLPTGAQHSVGISDVIDLLPGVTSEIVIRIIQL